MSHQPAVVVLSLCVLSAAFAPAVACAATGTDQPRRPAFYEAPDRLPARAGTVIRRQDVATRIRGTRTVRVLYRSVDGRGRPAAVSGTITFPTGRAPKGGWPVISWAHGTTGMADDCAPSLRAHAPQSPVQRAVDTWAARGFVVARTDYAGLGTPGPHAYLGGRGEGANVVDIVRAARRLDRRVGRRWVSAGHSQGGQAALFAAHAGARRAPELDLLGAASFAPASHIGELARAGAMFGQARALTGYAALILAGAAAVSPDVDLERLMSERAHALLPDIERLCLRELEQPGSFGALTPAELLREGADTSALLRVLDAQNPALPIRVPVVLYQGDADTTVFKPITDRLATALRRRGVRLVYRERQGATHVTVVTGAQDDFLRWAARLVR